MGIRSSTPGRKAVWRLAGIAVGAWALTILGIFGYEALTLRASRDVVDYNNGPEQPLHVFRMKGIVRPPIVEAGVLQVPEGRRVFATLTVEENLDMGAYTLARRGDRGRLAAGVHRDSAGGGNPGRVPGGPGDRDPALAALPPRGA